MQIKFTIDGVGFKSEEMKITIPSQSMGGINITRGFENLVYDRLTAENPALKNIEFDIDIDSVDFNL